jgi:dsDNA-binding SOS-regulon protein
MLKERTVKWNRDRGLLESFNQELELKMLSEEAKEFYMAETIPHKLAEYADFLFVLDGMKAKFGCRPQRPFNVNTELDYYKSILEWAKLLKADMYECLVDMIDACEEDIAVMIAYARGCVIKCNEMKGSKKKDGKVVKNKVHVDPTDMIREWLDDLICKS